MDFYLRNLGDFARDTATLSVLEIGVYDLLLDFYYASEKPLTLNRTDLTNLVRARNVHSRRALDKVLTMFFTRTETGYLHHRVEKEIERVNAKSSKARAAAEARWEAKKTDANASHANGHNDANAYANASGETMRTHCEGNANKDFKTKPKPKPLLHTLSLEQSLEPRTEKTVRGTRLPETWQLPDDWAQWAQRECGFSLPQVHCTAACFADHWHAKAGRDACKRDWLATWRNWCRREREWSQHDRPNGVAPLRTLGDSALNAVGRDLGIGEARIGEAKDAYIARIEAARARNGSGPHGLH